MQLVRQLDSRQHPGVAGGQVETPRHQPDHQRPYDYAGPREECGVFGVWAPGEEVAKLTYFGLYALQHLTENPNSFGNEIQCFIHTSIMYA